MLNCPRKIKLYGDLAEFVGVKEIETEAYTIADAIKCLIGNYPQTENYMMDKNYKILVNEKSRSLEELHFPSGQYDIKIVPVITGQGRGFTNIILGAALIGGAFLFTPLTVGGFLGTGAGSFAAAGFGTKAAVYVGGALILGGVSQMLAPVPQTPSEDSTNSFQFNSPVNTSIAGLSVPVLYGERIVGSVVINAGIDVERVTDT
tara:strand:- start:5964 stop:6575 length:612 start_codon:yes stop_codon:yes gene_type:complete